MQSSSHITKALRHTAIYSATTILSKIITFFLLPIYAHYLGGEGYGIMGMIDVVISVATLMIGYGIAGAMWRFYFQRETEEERKTLVSSTIILMFILVIGVSLPIFLFHNQLAHLVFGRSDLGYYLIIAALAFICEMTAKTAEAYILIRQKPFLYSSLALFRLVMGISLNIYFIVYLELGVLGFIYTNFICSLVGTVIAHAYTLGCVGIRFKKAVVRELFAFTLPLFPGYIALFIRGNADRVILRTFMGLAQVGVFEMLFKFVSLLTVFIIEPFSKSWEVKRYEICETQEGPETMARMYTFQLAMMLFLGLVLALEIPLLLRIMTPKEFWVGGSVAFIAVLSRILSASYYQFFFGLLYAKKTSQIAKIQIISSVLDVGLNISLIPLFGLIGAVTASCLVATIQCCMAFFMARVYYPIPFQWNKIIQMLLVAFVLMIVISQVPMDRIAGFKLLAHNLATISEDFIKTLHLDTIRNGKVLNYVVNSMDYIVEALIKFILSLLFIPAMAYLNILPRRFFNMRLFRNPFRAVSET
jgi:O-antigen/teichoic acid export membrane protein